MEQKTSTTKIDALMTELKVLRKGLGVQAKSLPSAVGTHLREACGVVDGDTPGQVREKVVTTLLDLIDRLPETQRRTAKILLGFDVGADQRYTARLTQLGDGADRNVRTMQRRADDVIYLIAEAACSRSATGTPASRAAAIGEGPWHTSTLEVSMVLLDVGAEVFETRRIVSHVPGLKEIEHSISLARPAPTGEPLDLIGLGIDVVSGGEVHSERMVSSTRVAFQLRPPRALDAGDEHDFFFRIRVPVLLAPFYCCTPEFSCERFELNVRFDRARLPDRVWRIDGELSKDAEDSFPIREQLTASSSGEVHADFRDLRPARSYGIGWHPSA
ncbi:hypothetical protein [Amycolatopsis sp. H20-H5]|uniref:hypothetical protein n=1 Tax=Amycolatopsis sp. H20-H5 TaxID=3046309 RepID=UPI002DB624B1|nr:hypothetical protein [Amycolatopsis sp. H20-H5]MEC3982141.1 hypothetical protein [Amycolatopsis sp. H20-H5]